MDETSISIEFVEDILAKTFNPDVKTEISLDSLINFLNEEQCWNPLIRSLRKNVLDINFVFYALISIQYIIKSRKKSLDWIQHDFHNFFFDFFEILPNNIPLIHQVAKTFTYCYKNDYKIAKTMIKKLSTSDPNACGKCIIIVSCYCSTKGTINHFISLYNCYLGIVFGRISPFLLVCLSEAFSYFEKKAIPNDLISIFFDKYQPMLLYRIAVDYPSSLIDIINPLIKICKVYSSNLNNEKGKLNFFQVILNDINMVLEVSDLLITENIILLIKKICKYGRMFTDCADAVITCIDKCTNLYCKCLSALQIDSMLSISYLCFSLICSVFEFIINEDNSKKLNTISNTTLLFFLDFIINCKSDDYLYENMADYKTTFHSLCRAIYLTCTNIDILIEYIVSNKSPVMMIILKCLFETSIIPFSQAEDIIKELVSSFENSNNWVYVFSQVFQTFYSTYHANPNFFNTSNNNAMIRAVNQILESTIKSEWSSISVSHCLFSCSCLFASPLMHHFDNQHILQLFSLIGSDCLGNSLTIRYFLSIYQSFVSENNIHGIIALTNSMFDIMGASFSLRILSLIIMSLNIPNSTVPDFLIYLVSELNEFTNKNPILESIILLDALSKKAITIEKQYSEQICRKCLEALHLTKFQIIASVKTFGIGFSILRSLFCNSAINLGVLEHYNDTIFSEILLFFLDHIEQYQKSGMLTNKKLCQAYISFVSTFVLGTSEIEISYFHIVIHSMLKTAPFIIEATDCKGLRKRMLNLLIDTVRMKIIDISDMCILLCSLIDMVSKGVISSTLTKLFLDQINDASNGSINHIIEELECVNQISLNSSPIKEFLLSFSHLNIVNGL